MEMTKVKTTELTGGALDWITIKATENREPFIDSRYTEDESGIVTGVQAYCWQSPSTDWSICGPLIQQFQIGFFHPCIGGVDENGELLDCLQATIGYRRTISGNNAEARSYEHDYLIAACRAVVIAVLGDEVSVPSRLVKYK